MSPLQVQRYRELGEELERMVERGIAPEEALVILGKVELDGEIMKKIRENFFDRLSDTYQAPVPIVEQPLVLRIQCN